MAHDDSDSVDDFIEAQMVKHPNLTYLDGFSEVKVLISTDHSRENVAVVSSGSRGGYDSARFVADGLLSACVYGHEFAAPPPESIIAAIQAVTGDEGCLVVTKSRHLKTFKIAVEHCKVTNEYDIEILNVPKLAESIEAAAAAVAKGLTLEKVKLEVKKVGNQIKKAAARKLWSNSKERNCTICGIDSKKKFKTAFEYNHHWDKEHKTA